MPSSVIQRYLYDTAAHELTITFVTGRVYAYEDVPPSVYQAFQASSSKGAFFNTEIRDCYSHRKLERVQPKRAAAAAFPARKTHDES